VRVGVGKSQRQATTGITAVVGVGESETCITVV
jgi:hypothetical protein